MNTKPEATNEMRAAFEARFHTSYDRRKDGRYGTSRNQDKWEGWQEAWQASRADAGWQDMEKALHMMDEVEAGPERTFTDHGHYCSLVQVRVGIKVNDVVTPVSFSKTHIIYNKSAMSAELGLQIIRFSREANEEKWRLASNPYSGVYLTPDEWNIVFNGAFRAGAGTLRQSEEVQRLREALAACAGYNLSSTEKMKIARHALAPTAQKAGV